MNDACIDLIYLDPPFNSNRNYEAPIGSEAAGAAFKDAWTLNDVDVHEHGELAERSPAAYAVIDAARQAHSKGLMAYLIMMAVRLLEMRRILKPTGSIWLHCDTTAGHYLKLLMDSLFGKDNFRNEVAWCYKENEAAERWFPKKHDTLFFYSKTAGYTFNIVRAGISEAQRKRYNIIVDGDRYANMKGKLRKLNPDGAKLRDWWEMPIAQSRERTGFLTQKPVALLDRIIKTTSNLGDLVLDPFCGCATTLVAADRLQRQWVGIDLSPVTIQLVNKRIAEDRGLWGGATALETPPNRTDLGDIPNYRTHRHRLYGEQEGVCVGCRTHFPFRVMEVDHVLPRSRGGTDHADNLQLLCSGCNRSKGGRTMAEWKAVQ